MTSSSTLPADPLDAALVLAAALEQREISYAIGGALAYGMWAVPRATIDVDLNVFVDDDGLKGVVAVLQSLGIAADLDRAQALTADRGMFQVKFGPYRVDVFTPSIPFYDEAERTRVRCAIEDKEAWFLGAEALAVFKLLFFRAKDIVDLQRMIAVQGTRLDHPYIRDQIVQMVGEDDERVQRWDELVRSYSKQ